MQSCQQDHFMVPGNTEDIAKAGQCYGRNVTPSASRWDSQKMKAPNQGLQAPFLLFSPLPKISLYLAIGFHSILGGKRSRQVVGRKRYPSGCGLTSGWSKVYPIYLNSFAPPIFSKHILSHPSDPEESLLSTSHSICSCKCRVNSSRQQSRYTRKGFLQWQNSGQVRPRLGPDNQQRSLRVLLSHWL